MDRKWITILFVVGGVFLLASVITFFVLQSQGQISLRPEPTPTPAPVPDFEITLPPSLEELADDYPEIADILTDPELGSVYKEFLVAYEEGGEEAALELARQRDILTSDDSAIRVTLVLDTTDHEPLINELESIGVTVVSAYEDQIDISVPVSLVQTQMDSDEPLLIFQQLTELEHVIALRLPERIVPNSSNIPGEGVAVTLANNWHANGFTGAGVRIGVLDLGFNGLESLEGVELPVGSRLQTFGSIDEDEVHGTACAEIIHEMAPDAELIYAWYGGTYASMGEAVEWLLSQGVNIISNSTGASFDPRDGTGRWAQLVDRAASQGVLWVNSAGNEADLHYRTTFNDSDGDGQHNFSPGENVLGVQVGYYGYVHVILTWDESWEYASQDYDLYLLDGAGNVLASSIDLQSGQQGHVPGEGFFVEVDEDVVYVAVVSAGTTQALPFDLFFDYSMPFLSTPEYSLCSPADAVGSLSVGAANFWDDSLAYYSSQGPTVDGRFKPEISAPTGVSGASYGLAPDEGFDGTSSSCPHVSGAAALVWQANPDFTRDQVVDYLLGNAIDLGPAGPDTGYGYGRLQLGEVPSGDSQPIATVTPIPIGEVTPQPIVTPTPVNYAPAPDPQPQPGPSGSNVGIALSLSVILLGGMCCLGTGFVLIGVIGLIVARRRSKKSKARPYPPPPPQRGQRRPPQRVPPPQARPRTPQARPGPSQPPRPQQPRQPPRQPQQPRSQPPAAGRCPKCNAPVRPGARFCPNCGNTL